MEGIDDATKLEVNLELPQILYLAWEERLDIRYQPPRVWDKEPQVYRHPLHSQRIRHSTKLLSRKRDLQSHVVAHYYHPHSQDRYRPSKTHICSDYWLDCDQEKHPERQINE